MFQDGLETLKGLKVKILVEEGAQPCFCKARSVAYALREIVERKLDDLVAEGTLEPTQFSEWASPILPVFKSDGGLVCLFGGSGPGNLVLDPGNKHSERLII